MLSIEQLLSEQFARWERRTRGWQVYDEPVAPEPPYVPFRGHHVTMPVLADDGRCPTLLGSLARAFSPAPRPVLHLEEPEPEPEPLEREPLVEFPLYLPKDYAIEPEGFQHFVRSLSGCREPLAFELLDGGQQVLAQLAVGPVDEPRVRQQVRAFFPELDAPVSTTTLEDNWDAADAAAPLVLEFGLQRESMLLLAEPAADPLVPLVGALNELAAGECALFQVLWQPVRHNWAQSLARSVTDAAGRAFFANAPHLVNAMERKIAAPLLGVVVRLAATSGDPDRSWEIIRGLAGGLHALADPMGNELVALENDEYPAEEHAEDLLRRQSRRPGMLLNLEEFTGLVHLPSLAVRSSRFQRQIRRTKPAPQVTRNGLGLVLGRNRHASDSHDVVLTAEQRRRHLHVIGASGSGKSTFLYNLIQQDITRGEGLAVLDPHGDLIDQILGTIPEHRMADVVLLDPSDEEYSIGFNILSAHSDLEKNLLASDLVSVFKRLSSSWGDQMDVVLNNALRAFLESTTGGTLLELRRFLLDAGFREKFLATVSDPDLVYYWRKSFAQLSGNRSIGPVVTRLETFLGPKPIRYMVAQTENRLDFGRIMDERKIFLARLAQGAIGQENAYLLGSLLMAKFYQLAIGRQRQTESSRRDFWLYLDEFHNFITRSTADFLAGARKYRIGLTLAHQELQQLQRDAEVASAVIANPYTRVCFRLGDRDAATLADGFSFFEPRDLMNLERGQAICRTERSDYDFTLEVPAPQFLDERTAADRRLDVITLSRKQYGTPRAEIEVRLRAQFNDEVRPNGHAFKPAPVPREPPLPTVNLEPPPAVIPPAEPTAAAPTESPVARVGQPAGSPSVNPPVPELGRGGNQHRTIQLRVKEAAERLGFRGVIEEQLPDGSQVDLMLVRGELWIACEITITNTIDYEIGNIHKCLKAGFRDVVVVGADPDKLDRLAQAAQHSFGPEAAAQVQFFLPDALLAYLAGLPVTPPPKLPPADPTERIVNGRKVKRTFSKLSPEETKAREAAALEELRRLMREKARKKPPRD